MLNKDDKALKVLIAIGMLVLLCAAIRANQSIIVPLLLSVFISLLTAPLIFWLESKKIPKTLSLIIVGSALLVVLFVVTSIFSFSLGQFINNLPEYEQKLNTMTDSAIAKAQDYNIPISSRSQLIKHIDPSAILGMVGSMLTNIGSIISNGLLIFFIVVFILFEASGIPIKLEKVTEMMGHKIRPTGEYIKVLRSYLLIKTLVSFATAILVYFMLFFLQVDYPFLWAAIAFGLNFVPNIGSIIAAVPPVLLALIDNGIWTSVGVAAGYIAFNTVIGNFVEPRLTGDKLGLSPLIVFLSLIFWGWLLGPVGMFLSVPLTMAVKIIMEHNEKTRWGGVILGP